MTLTDRITLYLTFLMTLVMFTAFVIKLTIVLAVT